MDNRLNIHLRFLVEFKFFGGDVPWKVLSMVVSMLLTVIQLVQPFFKKLDGPYQALAVTLLSKASYFYFGNSNSLATIDVGAGYVGMVVLGYEII